ncbi:sugar transferase [Helicobacter mesocricetorum]|nr:sugar transferase [Helicobacter mesocricetorum]
MNPNSAVERVRNHLAFKIGEVMQTNDSRGGGHFI